MLSWHTTNPHMNEWHRCLCTSGGVDIVIGKQTCNWELCKQVEIMLRMGMTVQRRQRCHGGLLDEVIWASPLTADFCSYCGRKVPPGPRSQSRQIGNPLEAWESFAWEFEWHRYWDRLGRLDSSSALTHWAISPAALVRTIISTWLS